MYVGWRSYPKVGRGEAVRGGGGGGGGSGGVGEVGVDVSQQVAHHRRDAGTHVLGGQAGEMPARSREREVCYATLEPEEPEEPTTTKASAARG